jgi:hypothetical protein
MTIRTWVLYLLGNREAILRLAADHRALWVGALFVLSAGLAREYDGEDLVHEPWYLLLPFAASLLTSFLLFGITWVPARLKGSPGPPLLSAYRAFLGLFWLTAPLAWFYGIPYERFLSPLDATRANLITLAVVSFWRVCLMIRVVSVLMGYRTWQAIFLVMILADAEMLLALQYVPRPILMIMSGVRMTQSEMLLAATGFWVNVGAFLSLWLWIIGALVATWLSRPAWQASATDSPTSSNEMPLLAMVSVAFWLGTLPFTQPEQILRRRVEHDLKEGRIAEALAEMSAHERSDFPPHWDPPPRIGYRERVPSQEDILAAIRESPPASWVVELFREKFGVSGRFRDEQ